MRVRCVGESVVEVISKQLPGYHLVTSQASMHGEGTVALLHPERCSQSIVARKSMVGGMLAVYQHPGVFLPLVFVGSFCWVGIRWATMMALCGYIQHKWLHRLRV